ncbi:FecR family protein [Chitinophaga sp. 30R24]|uniref:FecR family protein n=1 Tax=Chitinophaga sp. 30R24 TaxID=3248838 RepID=UPI003B91E847
MDKQLLEKYFKGQCTEQEAAHAEAWLSQADTTLLDEWMMENWDAANKKPATYRIWYSVAAAAILGIIATVSLLWQHQPMGRQLAIQWDTLSNNGNNTRLYTMPDGTEVWLSPHTVVIFQDSYNKQTRELWLKGEGYFNVVPDKLKPFKVHTGELTTTVLGTAFNIATANKADGSIQISLVQGKISVTQKDQFTKVLLPGEMLSYASGSAPLISPFPAQEVLDWKNGKIYFDNATLADALTKLQQRYGCKMILIDQEMRYKKISGVFKMELSPEKILSALAYVHNLSYKRINDSTYQITGVRK